MSDLKDFVIQNGVLIDYIGAGGDVVIPEGVTSIGYESFYQCYVESVTIPSTVTIIDESAFQDIVPLLNVYFAEDSQLKEIGESAFAGCRNLENITLPEGVTYIGSEAFYDCSERLESITIPSSVKVIDDGAFANCHWLQNVNFAEGSQLERIGDGAFYNTSLTSITIPNSVTYIGDSAFSNCNNLESITLPFVGGELNGTYHAYFGEIFGLSFDRQRSIFIPQHATCVPKSLKSVVITGGDRIDDYAFYGCRGLTSITIPSSVKSIGKCAFFHCSSLTSISISNSVTDIGPYAFKNCASLTSISIPSSVTSIGSYAFYNCNSLKSAIFEDPDNWSVSVKPRMIPLLTSAASNAIYLTSPRFYVDCEWHKK